MDSQRTFSAILNSSESCVSRVHTSQPSVASPILNCSVCMQPPWLSLTFSGYLPPGTSEEHEHGQAAFTVLESTVCVRALASLELRGSFGGLGMGDYQRGARLFQRAQSLRRLVLVIQGFENVGEFCAGVMQSLPSLEDFSLDSPGCDMRPVFASLRTVSALTSLRLGDSVDPHAVARALAFMPNIDRLDLEKVSGAEWFLMALGRTPAMSFLRLREVEGQAGAQALAWLMQSRMLSVELVVFPESLAREFVRHICVSSGSTLAVNDLRDGEALVAYLFRSGCAFGCSNVSTANAVDARSHVVSCHGRCADKFMKVVL